MARRPSQMHSAIAPDEEAACGRVALRRRWRVLFTITTSDIGGTETVLRELALRLDRCVFDPVVCSLCRPARIAEQIAETGTPVLTLGMSEQPRVAQLATGAVALAHRIDALGIDLVQSFLYRANVLAGVAARLSRRRPVVVAGQRSLTPWSGWPAALAARWTWRFADRVVAVSQAVRAHLIEADRVEPHRIVLIENGVDTAHYTSIHEPGARAALGCAPDTVVVGAVGRLSREKGFQQLIESVALARRRSLPLSLVLAGDGPLRSALEAQAHALGLDGHARFLGVRGDLRPVYAAIDVFALPSIEEGSPNALLEAMACGRAVVAARVGGVPEIVEHGRSGLLVEPESPPAFADALACLAADEPLRRRLGAQARRRVIERFDVLHMVERHARLYRQLLDDRARRHGTPGCADDR